MTIFPVFGTNCSPSTRVSGITDIEARLVLVYVGGRHVHLHAVGKYVGCNIFSVSWYGFTKERTCSGIPNGQAYVGTYMELKNVLNIIYFLSPGMVCVSQGHMTPTAMHALGFLLVLASLAEAISVSQRRKVVQSFNVRRNASSDSTPLQVGNGNFAFGADITGLQTFKPYGILSTWGWHNFSLPTTPNQTSIDGTKLTQPPMKPFTNASEFKTSRGCNGGHTTGW